ncbi:DUF3037 domain-containing protein [Moritella sp. 5]|uniref:DUF3037 domain-containing protein n=1 Tax=Moritella sp. 5 TaxID=2746231 RepID=UPI001BACCE1A|nr:DUF3037 domain-containing protein [Moritella sp. 5]QUM82024.1 DUF3037 domain-containing protein [Moritella sp. 5]
MSMSCLYAIVRFAPYAETSEFANVGIVLCVPQTGFIGFKLAPPRFKRVSQFFDDLDNKLFSATRNNIEKELCRLQEYAHKVSERQLADVFIELIRERESIIRFGEVRSALLKGDPQEFIEKLYKQFIGRDFLTKEYRENVMVKDIRNSLRQKGVPKFKEDKIANELFEATFPLVNRDNSPKIIKPLAFQQSTTTKIIEHGELWHWKVKRLIKTGSLDEKNVLLPFEEPKCGTEKLKRAYQEVVTGFKELNVQVCDFKDKNELMKFATRDLSPDKFKLI